jgi:hypothetical protein
LLGRLFHHCPCCTIFFDCRLLDLFDHPGVIFMKNTIRSPIGFFFPRFSFFFSTILTSVSLIDRENRSMLRG